MMTRLLYGLDAVVLTKKDSEEIGRYYKNLLRQIQGLPKNVATEVIYILAGKLPLQAEIDIRKLNLFGAICRSENEKLKSLATRQLSIDNNFSWFHDILELCQEYNISLEAAISNPWRRQIWKKYIQETVRGKWTQEILEKMRNKSSMSMIDISNFKEKTPHDIWKSCISHPRLVTPTVTRAILLSGTYLTMERRAKFDKNISAKCSLCCSGSTEDIAHFLIDCVALSKERDLGMQLLQKEGYTIPTNSVTAVKILLNGPKIQEVGENKWKAIHKIIANLCHSLHLARSSLIKNHNIHK